MNSAIETALKWLIYAIVLIVLIVVLFEVIDKL